MATLPRRDARESEGTRLHRAFGKFVLEAYRAARFIPALVLPKQGVNFGLFVGQGPDTATQDYDHLTGEYMPGIQRCFFGTLDCLQQSNLHVLEL